MASWSFYRRMDDWVKGLSHTAYSGFLGLSGGLGVLIAGSVISRELRILDAVTVAVTLFLLEIVLGKWRTQE